jgi:4-aminobutyrate aminotransferase-like enzyme
VREENLPANAATQGSYLLEQLKPFEELYPAVGEVRGKGLMIALDLVKNRTTREPIDPQDGYANAVAAATRAAGALVRPVGTKIIISPPLVLQRAHADALVAALHDGFRANQ